MKNIINIILIIFAFIILGCEKNIVKEQNLTLVGLQIVSESDTLYIMGGNEKKISVEGIFIEYEDNTIVNKGGITSAYYTILNTDTLIQQIDENIINWHSSYDSIATINNGIINSTNYGGYTQITASIDSISSNTLNVQVSKGEPLLYIDPPLTQIVFFKTSDYISGSVIGLGFSLKINSNSVQYSNDGYFNQLVNLNDGENIFNIIAKNNDDIGLSATKIKKIINISYNDIVGYWEGETLTRPFSFNIYYLLEKYVIDGDLTVDLSLLGGPLVVQDIIVFGLINDDGTIDAELSKSSNQMSILGNLIGSFSDTGLAEGSFTLSIEFLGNTFSHNEKWFAEKQ